jgi:hypothetical protein
LICTRQKRKEKMEKSNRLPVLAADIRAAHDAATSAARTAVERAIDAGVALLEAKTLLPHGGWLPWLKEHCGLSARVAQNYMRLARHKAKYESDSYLTISAALGAMADSVDPSPVCDDIDVVMAGLDDIQQAMALIHQAVLDASDPEVLLRHRAVNTVWSGLAEALHSLLSDVDRRLLPHADVVLAKQIHEAAGQALDIAVELRTRSELYTGILMREPVAAI